MDVSQPLPDVPGLEPLRQYDPATIEWDKRMGRPPDFWRNFPDESYYELLMVAEKAVKAFPWGAKRQHALYYVGWNPTCFSEMTWRGMLEPENDDEKTSHWQRCLNDPVDKPEVEGAARKKYFERLANLFNATFQARKKTLALAKSLLAAHELSNDDNKYFTSYVNATERRLKAFAATTQSIEKDGLDRAVPGKAEDPAHLHGVWIDEIGNQAAIQRKISDYVDADNFEKHRTEHTKINFEAIVATTIPLNFGKSTLAKLYPKVFRVPLVPF